MDATSADYARAAFDLIDDFEHTKTPEQVVEQLASTLSVFGFSTILITGVPEPPQRVEPYFLMNGWPRGWSGHNSKANNHACNPPGTWCRRTIDQVEWSEGVARSNHSAPAVPCIAPEDDAGLTKHYLVPVIRATGSTSCVTMAGERPEFESRARRAVYMLSLYAHARAVSLLDCTDGPGPRRELTLRQRADLHWSAGGKSAWDVSVILGISERTGNWLISRAGRKLKAGNRTHEVVTASPAGQIYI